MSGLQANISIPVDLTNPGQFFACCGLLELASRLDEDAVGWFEDQQFLLASRSSLADILGLVRSMIVTNAMSEFEKKRIDELESMSKKERAKLGFEEEKKALDAIRRESPVILRGSFEFRIDWFCDDIAGGSRFKTWAGQQSVLSIATAMHTGLVKIQETSSSSLWKSVTGGGLPFNFDSDLGAQGTPLDVGFSLDALSGSEATRIDNSCRPGLELLAFIGLQRFRPREIPQKRNRFIYVAWEYPLPVIVAATAASQAISAGNSPIYEFRLLYRTKYLKSFLPAVPFQGDNNE